jgi:hypothetical protein
MALREPLLQKNFRNKKISTGSRNARKRKINLLPFIIYRLPFPSKKHRLSRDEIKEA